MAETDGPRQDLGIEDWYLESNHFGHYLVFDASEASAKRLVEAVGTSGLGVRRWAESVRAADNGKFYDWFIRLEFDGSRDECIRKVEALVAGVQQYGSEPRGEEISFDEGAAAAFENDLQEMGARVMAAAGHSADLDEVTRLLNSFGGGPSEKGYLAWRYMETVTRPGYSGDDSLDGRLRTIASIIRDDKQLVARLVTTHGRFLENPHLVRRAIDAEFDKIDLEANWRSSDDALRRARASLLFLRHAVVLVFGGDDRDDQLLSMVRRLAPPALVLMRNMPGNVVAATENLRRMITLVEDLLNGHDSDLVELYETGRAELLAIERGDFDLLVNVNAEDPRAHGGTQPGDLPFVILPPGARIQSFLGELRRSGSYRGGVVDPGRLKVLEDLWNRFEGCERSLYRGIFPSSGRDNGYVVLSIKYSPTEEDVIAISPWKHEHATFVVRDGCGSGRPWRQVLSQTKDEAKRLGARRLVFKPNPEHGLDEYEAMQEKIIALLACHPENFARGQLYFDDYDDCYRVGALEDSDARFDTGLNGSPNLIQRILNWF